MKITNLECPSCGGRLKPMEGNPQIMVCEYCNSQFVIEDDRTIHYHVHQYDPVQLREVKENHTNRNPFVVGITAAALMIILMVVRVIIWESPSRTSLREPSLVMPEVETWEEPETDWGIEEAVQEPQSAHSPLYEAILKVIFEKEADQVTEEELAELTYLKVEAGSEGSRVSYSFESPYEGESFEPIKAELESLPWDSRDLNAFTGLQKVDVQNEQVESLSFDSFPHLKGLLTEGLTPSEIALLLPDPGQLLELSLDRPERLDGISEFTNLEILNIERTYVPDVKQLVPLKSLRSLSIEERTEEGTSLTDYAALSTLTQLEQLKIESPAIRDLSFLKTLTNLKSLSVCDSDAISLEPIGELTQLTTLELADNDAVQDYRPVMNLTGLTTLYLDKNTSQTDPDLSSLSQLETLDMCGFMSVSFLNRMGNLKELSMHGCNIDEASALSGLTGLESLTCYADWTYAVPLKNVNFIDSMTNLKSVDFSGGSDDYWGAFEYNLEILGDISNVFNHPGLEKLVLNNCMFAIDFDRITENPTLKQLELKEINLKENFYVETYNGMTDLWYDDVSFAEHVDFLTNYPNLERLCLDGNQLTDIGFASQLHQLTYLSLNNNYVTELTPLNQAEDLRYLDIRMNPITNTIENDDSIVILKQ